MKRRLAHAHSKTHLPPPAAFALSLIMTVLARSRPAPRRKAAKKPAVRTKKQIKIELMPEEIALENAILQAAARDVATQR
jgi:hypothetical protein